MDVVKPTALDLTKTPPRSPNAELAGIVSLPRMIDKTRAHEDGNVGEYDVDCPHDKPVLALLGIDFRTFADTIKSLKYDDAEVGSWASGLLSKKTPRELQAFNDERRAWKPDAHSAEYFNTMRDQVAPGRTDVRTWFQLLDLDEGRTA